MSTEILSIRGPLKYMIETSSPQLEAGRKFSVSVRITNPYDVPVKVGQVMTKLPAKFRSFSARQQPTFRDRWNDLVREANQDSGTRAKAESPERAVTATPQGPDDEVEVELQPGNSTVRVFALLALGWMLFTPSTYNLNLEISYIIDGKLNRDTVSFQMNMRSPLRAIIIGSIVGSVVGFVVRDNFKENSLQHFLATNGPAAASLGLTLLLSVITSVLASAMIVVAFARKKDAQPILSIEDFYGGLFIGFLSAYGGSTLLNQVASPPSGGK